MNPVTRHPVRITPELLLRAYRAGLFPMAESRDAGRLYWLDPEMRGILPLQGFHLPRRLARTVLSGGFTVTADTAFSRVITLCAAPAPGREDSWINPEIEALFTALHELGVGHSVEVWQNDRLVGGLYGVAMGGVFFGESMFSRVRDASKVALVHLVARLRLGGFVLLDTQFITTHLTQFGALEIPRASYRQRLSAALETDARWLVTPDGLEEEIRALRV
ncbi:leucyl/phenylalanyl-tRNA--protein transferase [Roseomonas aerophila]|uniref:Leucyl/phenylalanyl-tRNA--protein transferase n=1 Tax=Teichococcus aerophilus TaxID=1224513 RepID=A0ABR7RT78_9PROT|nr:leucyl/phenylalanyl-tRNA--protein transferase [Pseudoroseomonas aerophila]MBC9209777.1 leucyl/phenylalanyl-tRNA--protein transferase [Pseudoroseomonas aerophila]